MNGSANGHGISAGPTQANGDNINLLHRIHEALDLVHRPYTSNESRQQASAFLEDLKTSDEAPYHGFTLASDKTQAPVIRHYALSLIEHAIKHKWAGYTSDQAAVLRNWVLELSRAVSSDDPLYLRNKTAQLWVEIAKRSWAAEWVDMDSLLVQLWELPGSVIHKEFVLFILETISEEVFNGDDAVAVLREGALSKACVEIFTPAADLAEAFPNRQRGETLRCGEEGWLVRLGGLLNQCLMADNCTDMDYQNCVVKILCVYKSVLPWAIPRAIVTAQCVQHMCKSLGTSSVPVQLASVQALYALYSRLHFSDEEFLSLVCPMYTSQVVDLLRKLFEWSAVDPHDIDDEKYLFAKKLSEMVSNLGNFIESKISALPEACDLPSLLNLFLVIAQSESSVISIPVLVTWTRLLRSETIGSSPTVAPLIAPLLELCSGRLMRYESMPEDLDDSTLIFLLEDIDTVPERHAFLGNYRRYCAQIIELVVRRKKSEALYHILGHVDQALQHLYDGQAPFTVEHYSKISLPILRLDAQFGVVEAALKGYMKWRAAHGSEPQQDEQERLDIENNVEAWCERLLERNFEDPIMRKRILQLAVAFSTSALDKKVGYMLKVLEHILMSRPTEHPNYGAYSEAVKELQTESTYELQRLASKMPDQLLDVYDQLEKKVNEILASSTLDGRRRVSYQTFLFTIIHRAKKIDPMLRVTKLKAFVDPVQMAWQNPEMDASVSSFSAFCDLLGLTQVKNYLVSRNAHEIQDWGLYELDAEGQAVQTQLEERLKALPLRATKSFLGCSVEKVDKGSAAYEISCALWHDALPTILPNLLKFLSYAHAFHNPANWSELPPEMGPMVSRVLTDRFWQAGISSGSKDEFYARVTGTKSTMEGFASSIRSSVRTVREACYAILWCMSRLGGPFYGFNELPGPLAHALFADALCLSSHQLIALLNVVRLMIDDCPVQHRAQFVPPVLASCFTQMDLKCSSEWERLTQKQIASVDGDGDTLTEEMKEESILRQLTHAAVMMIGGFLDPARPNPGAATTTASAKDASTYEPGSEQAAAFPNMRKFCLSSASILEPLLLFCCHAIRMRDTRCCGVVLRVFRSIVPDFASLQQSPLMASIREYISTDVLKAAITSLHEPYFVELQKDIAHLIAAIIVYYAPLTNTPRQILLSLPGMEEKAVDKCIDYLSRPAQQQRQQRALVLDLLRDLKGISISEQGRISKPISVVRKERSKMQQGFMKVQETNRQGPNATTGGDDEGLDGVAGLFDV